MKKLLLFLTVLFLWTGSSWGQTITIGTGTSTGRYPLNDYYTYSRSQMLFLASEINLAGTITHIKWYRNDAGADPNAIGTTEIWLMETTATSLTGTTWEGPGTLVKTISNIDLGSGADWFDVDIDDFVYSGSNSLLVSVRTQNAPYTSPHSLWRYTTTSPTYMMKAGNSDGTNPPTIATTYYRPNIQFEISTGDMSFTSSTTEQASTAPVVIGSTDQAIVRLNVVTTGSTSPFDVSAITFNTTGTTSTSDITAAHVYYTTTTTFSTATPFGSVVNNPSGSFTVNGTQTLSGGNNYFWLAYDISGSATEYNVIDAQCTQFVGSGVHVPDITSPAGTRTIRGSLVGTYTIDNTTPTGGTNYNTFTEAVDELNTLGISGAVTFNVIAGQTFTKTCPASPDNYAYAIGTTGTVTNTITFQKSGAGANPLLNITGTSATTDIGVFIYGADYVTFNGIDISDAGTTSTDYLDRGFFLQGPADDNCSFVTIKNSTIDLNKNNTSSKGIYLYSNAPASSANGNCYNTFLNNNIQDTYNGYYFSGNSTYPDMGNTIGIESSGRSTVQNVGNSLSTAIYATYFYSQNNLSFSNTLIDNVIGSSTIYAVYYSSCGGTNSINNNTISNITGTGSSTVYGMYCSPVSTAITNIYSNQITGFDAKYNVHGLYVGAGTENNIYKNNINNIAYTGTSSYIAYGLSSSGGTTNNIYNNFVYDIKAPASTGTPGTRALNFSSGTTANLFYNTVYLDYVSTVASNQSAALYVTTSPTTLNMKNNIFVNNCDMTTGTRAVAFYKSSTSVTNLPGTNNNNLFYAGTPGSQNLIFYNGTAALQTLADFKAFISPGEQQSVSENPHFISGVSPYDLKINTTVATQIESGGTRITSPIAISTDYFGDIRQGETGYAGTGTAPDIGADEFNGIGLDQVAPAISYTVLSNTTSTSNRAFSAVVITDPGSGVNITTGTKPRVYYKKSTDANDETGWKEVEANGASTPFDFTINYSLLADGSVSIGDIIQYFVVAQDLAGTPNVGINSGTFATTPSSVALTSAAFPIGGTIYQYTIVGSISGAKTVGTGGDYATLTDVGGLFADINSKAVIGNITVTIISDITEPGTNALNQWPEEGTGNYTLTIQPDAATLRTISGTYAGGLIRLNGADRVTIDGRFGGAGNYLAIGNASTVGSAALQIISLGDGAGAINNTIRNCNISAGSNTVTTYALFAGSATLGTAANDNDDLSIINNVFTKAYNAIWVRSSSTATALNDNLIITGNTIGSDNSDDYVVFRGVDIQGADAPVISQNEIFNLQTSSSYNIAGIDLGSYVSGADVSGNMIHGFRSINTGGYGAYGINISSATGNSNNEIVNNVIYDFITDGDGTSTTFNPFGIRISGGTGHKIYYNSINFYGAFTSTTTSDLSAAIVITSSAATGMDIRNNVVSNSMTGGGTTKCYGIYAVSGTTFGTINYNDYFASGAFGVLGYLGADKTTLGDWQTATGQDINSISSDPMFTTETNLQPLAGSPVLATGTPIGGITTDYTGATRSGTTPSMGAYEGGVVPALVDWANLQWPPTATITEGETFDAYAQVYEPGVTDAVGQGAGIESWFGWNDADTDPSTWTNWIEGTYNGDAGNNDEYMAAIGAGITSGTYYYASRFRITGGTYQYGGYTAGGGNFWGVGGAASGVLTVNEFAITTFPYTQSFDGTTFAPASWTNVNTAGTGTPGIWDRQTTGTYPTCAPHSGAGMARYNCFNLDAGTKGELNTPSITFPGDDYFVSFWMYRDIGYTTNYDLVNVYYNTSSTSTGATLLGTINRYIGSTPVVSANGWYQYIFAMPSGATGSGRYIIFEGVSEYGNNMFIDDVEIDQIPATRTWTGGTDTDWNTAGNWDYGIPGSTNNVTIPAGLTNYPTLSAAGSCNNLTIQSSASGNGSILGDNNLTVSGSISVERYITGGVWHDLSASTQNQTVNNLYFNHTPDVWLKSYNEPTNTRLPITSLSTPLTSGAGFEIWVETGNNVTVSYNGALRTTDVTLTTSSTPALSYSGADPLGYNLIGNPFASPLDWDLGTWGLSNMTNGIWVWNGSTYLDWVGGAGSLTGGIIPMGQGFFVQTTSAAASITIPMDARVHSAQAYYKGVTNAPDHMWIKAIKGEKIDQLTVVFAEDATLGFDNGRDSRKMLAFYGNAPQIYAVEQDEKFGIDGLPTLTEAGRTVNVMYHVGESGDQQLLANLESLPDVKVLLEDAQTGIVQDLNENPEYLFEAAQGDDPNRFTLYFNPTPTMISNLGDHSDVHVYAFQNEIYVRSEGEAVNASKTIWVYDMYGRVILNTVIPPSTLTKIPLDVRNTPVIVKVVGTGSVVTSKVVIN